MKAEATFSSKGVTKNVEVEVDKPTRSEVLVRTEVCGICMGDVYTFQGKPDEGQMMGHEYAGIVAEVGEDIKDVKAGSKVTTLGGPAFAQYYRTNYPNVAPIRSMK